jgi:short-subunit dehydrogenase
MLTGVLIGVSLVVVVYFALRTLSRKFSITKNANAIPWDPQGKVIVITGASSGIGAELARIYSCKNAKVAICARREDELKKIEQVCKEQNPNVQITSFKCDVANKDELKMFIDHVAEKFGGVIDCLFLNAGISMAQKFEEVEDLSIFETLMKVNYFGSINCTYFALPYLKKSIRSKIVVISSGAGMIGIPTRTGYSATKFALHGFFEALRCELAPKYGTEVTVVCPGVVKTDIDRTRLGTKPEVLDMSKAMPVEEACRIIYEAVSIGERDIALVPELNFIPLAKIFCPELVDRLIIKKASEMQKNTTQ